MAMMKKLLGEGYNENEHSALGKNKHGWDQTQFAEMQKFHTDKCSNHRTQATMHWNAIIQNKAAVPKVSADVQKHNHAMGNFHSDAAKAHERAASAYADLTKLHIDGPEGKKR